MKKISLSLSIIFLLCSYGCNTSQKVLLPSQGVQANSETPITVKVNLDNPPFKKSGSTLSGFAKFSNGKIIEYKVVKSGSSYKAETVVYKSKGNKLESHPSTATEAETILKLAKQGGYASEYKEFKNAYTKLGLI